MAKITLDGNSQEVEDNSHIQEACEELGVPFGCKDGVCGSCLVEVESGMENLNEKTEAEEQMNCEENQRLACQCNIKSGDVVFKL